MITETRKGNEFIRVRCEVENGAYDHLWYHTIHTNFRNIKKLSESVEASEFRCNVPQLFLNKEANLLPIFRTRSTAGPNAKQIKVSENCARRWSDVAREMVSKKRKWEQVKGQIMKQLNVKPTLNSKTGLRIEKKAKSKRCPTPIYPSFIPQLTVDK